MPTLLSHVIALVGIALAMPAFADYPWLGGRAPTRTLATAIAPPAGFARTLAKPGSYAAWLRGLPLLPADAPVLLYNGKPKPNQDVHAAVVDLDVGSQDLQQCADAIMRLRAEYLWQAHRASEISFKLASGERDTWPGGNRAAFVAYLRHVFAYANTSSLRAQLAPPAATTGVQAGDVLVQGPPRPNTLGHAVMVLDVAQNAAGEQIALIGQSYTPAQQVEVLVNGGDKALSPWYRVAALTGPLGLQTPQWRPFRVADLRRF